MLHCETMMRATQSHSTLMIQRYEKDNSQLNNMHHIIGTALPMLSNFVVRHMKSECHGRYHFRVHFLRVDSRFELPQKPSEKTFAPSSLFSLRAKKKGLAVGKTLSSDNTKTLSFKV